MKLATPESYKSGTLFPSTSGQDFGYAMALVEVIRILNNIDKKLYVVIKKIEELQPQRESEVTDYAEDMGYQPPDTEDHELQDK